MVVIFFKYRPGPQPGKTPSVPYTRKIPSHHVHLSIYHDKDLRSSPPILACMNRQVKPDSRRALDTYQMLPTPIATTNVFEVCDIMPLGMGDESRGADAFPMT